VNRRARWIALALLAGAAFLALAGLVWAGTLSGLDNHAIHHWMPWARPPGRHRLVSLRAAFLPETRSTLGGTLVGLWAYPASPFVSLVLVLLCARFLERRAALAVLALWVVANAIEVAGKLTITRPSIDIANLRDSFPSGHTVRALVLAAAVGWTWRRAGPAVLAWALTVPLALVALGDHVPTDVIGGALLAACLILATRSVVSRT
jgi:membrane-associated phospholipid phosphatase